MDSTFSTQIASTQDNEISCSASLRRALEARVPPCFPVTCWAASGVRMMLVFLLLSNDDISRASQVSPGSTRRSMGRWLSCEIAHWTRSTPKTQLPNDAVLSAVQSLQDYRRSSPRLKECWAAPVTEGAPSITTFLKKLRKNKEMNATRTCKRIPTGFRRRGQVGRGGACGGAPTTRGDGADVPPA